MTQNITIQEAQYVDERAGNDKFFRTFAFGSSWVTQYGRNGTIGTFTKIVDAGSAEAAQRAAEAKFASKVKKGYNPERYGVVASPSAIDQANLTVLDELAEALPAGQASAIITAPVSAVVIEEPAADDQSLALMKRLSLLFEFRGALPEDMHPALPMRPMLASTQSDDVVADAMADHKWFAQYKYDGDRVVVEVVDGEIRVLNRQGQQKVKNVGKAHLPPFTALHGGRWVFDGEVVGRTLVLFDLAAATAHHTTIVDERSSFSVRYRVLNIVTQALGIPKVEDVATDAPIVLAPIATTNHNKAEYLRIAKNEQREGIVLRHADGTYESGRRSTTLIKHKLIKDADVVIASLHGAKQSANLAVRDTDGTLVEVGAASTIGKGEVLVGDVWVVTFLYVTDPQHPRLFQPRLVRKRDDKTADACTIDQFVDAGTARKV